MDSDLGFISHLPPYNSVLSRGMNRFMKPYGPTPLFKRSDFQTQDVLFGGNVTNHESSNTGQKVTAVSSSGKDISSLAPPVLNAEKPFPDRYRHVFTPDDYYIAGITFGVKGPEEILAQSVCEITENTIYNKNVPRHDAINDVRMGTVDRRIVCGTCGHGVEKCNGHTGHITLPVALYNVGFLSTVLRIIRTVCYFCSTLLIPRDSLPDTDEKFNVQKFEYITSSARSYNECWSCKGKMPTYKQKGLTIERTWDSSIQFADVEEKKMAERFFDAGFVREILQTISDEDCIHMGLNPTYARPEYFITTVLLIPPPLIRPAIMITEGSKAKGQDDLTRKLQDVLKKSFIVKGLLKKCKGNLADKSLMKAVDDLQYDYAVYLNNELKGVPQDTQRSGAPIRGVAQRIKTKGGIVRNNLNGKRVDFSARTVISADPQLDVDQIGVPKALATILTKPITVTALNIQECSQRIINGADRIDGACMIEYPDGRTKNLSACTDRHLLALPFGAKVHRYLQDDDYVLFNRHPSLHKESVMAHRVKLMPVGNTFRMNLVATTPYNADFDGDEMNIHITQSMEADAELRGIMAIHNHILGAQSNKPTMGLVQDGLTGIYLMTRKDVFLTREQIMNLMMTIKYEAPYRKQWVIPHPAIVKPIPLWTGKQLVSMIMPPLFLEKYVRGAGKETSVWDPHERVVILRAGNLLVGTLCKATVGSASGGIIHIMSLDYDGRVTCNFMSDVQRLINAWLLIDGFSVGISDCIVKDDISDRIQRKIKLTLRKVGQIYNQIKKIPNLPIDAAEPPVFRTLSEVLNSAGSIASQATGQHNRINCMITSGSKGNPVNIAQITACVGQQSVEGRRITPKKNNRTLSAFSNGSLDPRSRGFVTSSYTQGLNPTEFFFHGMGGREGLVDTAVKSITGDTPIVVFKDGKISRYTIGSWIDHQIDANRLLVELFPHEANMELLRTSGVFIPTVDDNGVLSWGEITAITRHDPSPFLYLVKTESGREVNVVESKSLLVFDPITQTLKQTQTVDVQVGDQLPVTITYPTPPGDNNFQIKIIKTLHDIRRTREFVGANFIRLVMDNNLQMEKTAWLLSGLGIFCNLNSESSTLLIQNQWFFKYQQIFIDSSTTSDTSRNVLHNVLNDVVLDRIISITKYQSTEGQKVYDLTIPSTLNFGLANGLQVADTSETGYLQRRMMKAMESMRVHYDQTVRDAQGMIIDFCYGGDGMDATFLDAKTDLSFLDWTQDQIHEYVTGNDDINISNPTWIEEKDEMMKIRKECVQSKITPLTLLLDRTCFLPMSIPRVIQHAKMLVQNKTLPVSKVLSSKKTKRVIPSKIKSIHLDNISTMQSSSIDEYRPTSPQYHPTSPQYHPTSPQYRPTSPQYHPTSLPSSAPLVSTKKDSSESATVPSSESLSYAEVWKDVKMLLKVVGSQSLYLRAALQFELNSRHIIDDLKITRQEWMQIKDLIINKWERSRAQPGEMVGALSAESVGEGNTQGTLNTFHFSGIASKNVTLGVPRLKELLDVSKNIKIPSLTIFLKNMYNVNEEMVTAFACSLERTCLEDAVIRSDVILDSDFFHSKYPEDQEMLDISRPFYSHLDFSRQFISSYVIRIKLHKHLLITRHYSIIHVMDAIQSFVGDKAYVWFNPPEHENWIIRIRLADIKTSVEKLDDGRRKQTDRALSYALQNTLVKNVIIGGLKNIEKATARQLNVTKIQSDKITKHKEWVIDTEGSGFGSIGILPSVDWRRTYSNDVSEILAVLGLEAAAHVLFSELKSVLSFNGSTINDRHIMMIVNTMTYRGTLMSFNRFGFNRQHDTSVLGRSSFEEPMEILIEGGIFGQHDALEGVSERIMVGRRADIGTNAFGRKVAPDMFQFNKKSQKTWRTCVSAALNPWEKYEESHQSVPNSLDSPPPSPLLRAMESKEITHQNHRANKPTSTIISTKGIPIINESFSPVISPVIPSVHGCHLDSNYFTLTQVNRQQSLPYRPSSPDINSDDDDDDDENKVPIAITTLPVANVSQFSHQPESAAAGILSSAEICMLLDSLTHTGVFNTITSDVVSPPTNADFEKLQRDIEKHIKSRSADTDDSMVDDFTDAF